MSSRANLTGTGGAPTSLYSAAGTASLLRPVVFVVNATLPPRSLSRSGSHASLSSAASRNKYEDDPFDVKEPCHDGDAETAEKSEEENLYEAFLAAIQGKSSVSSDDEVSASASYSSSRQGSPERGIRPGAIADTSNDAVVDTVSQGDLGIQSPSALRRMSPFSRLRGAGRWLDGKGGQNALADDMEDDPDDAQLAERTPHPSTLNPYGKDPPVEFMSRRARVVSVSRRHAFPPSKYPDGKVEAMGAMSYGEEGNSWHHAYDVASEGVLPSGWIEKHVRALPSALVLVTTLKESNMELAANAGMGGQLKHDQHVVQAVEDLRMTLAEKRKVPIHLVCIIRQDDSELDPMSRASQGHSILLKERIASLTSQCYMAPNQVTTLRYPTDFEPDKWAQAILNSPYLPPVANFSNDSPIETSSSFETALKASNAQATMSTTIMINPLLRSLDRTLRDSSALYYARLAEHQEKKASLWRARYQSSNSPSLSHSNAISTMAAMRSARYSIKAGTLREFQMRTGAGAVIGAGGGGNATVGSSGSRWTDKGSPAMRHYDEAYRWLIELHRRVVEFRFASASAPTSVPAGNATIGANNHVLSSQLPITPGNTTDTDDTPPQFTSPRITESPGGGIGVELSLPPLPIASPVIDENKAEDHPNSHQFVASPTVVAPPALPLFMGSQQRPIERARIGPRTGTLRLQSELFFVHLLQQCRAVASIVNAKLLRCAIASSGEEAVDQWRRHRLMFLTPPLGVGNFHPREDDDFFGPVWHRAAYMAGELLIMACISEGRWRRAANHAAKRGSSSSAPSMLFSSSYHQAVAPWKAYGELAEAILVLGREVRKRSEAEQRHDASGNQEDRENNKNNAANLFGPTSGRRRFVGSIVSGSSGVGTLQWLFENESKRDHRDVALEYILHSLDLLEENESIYSKIIGNKTPEFSTMIPNCKTPDSSARLHYLAGRILMGLGSPVAASAHLKIASKQTKKWPSLHLSVQKILLLCLERCSEKEDDGLCSEMHKADSKDVCIEMLLQSHSCQMLSPTERATAQSKAWGALPSAHHSVREIVWKDDDVGEARAPFEFTVSFLNSTHAICTDKVLACVSIKSSLDFPIYVEAAQLLTTSGPFNIPHLGQCADKSQFQSWAKSDSEAKSSAFLTNKFKPNYGILFDTNQVAYFLIEIRLPSDPSAIALGKKSADLSKFIPKSARLCNMGYCHAGGNMCVPRSKNDDSEQIHLTSKPIPVSNVEENVRSFLGGIPFVCYGLALTLKPLNGTSLEGSSSSLRLEIIRRHSISPLGRTGSQELLMEECNYMAHAWSRLHHHPWCLGPRCLRVLGPRPMMQVTNLTDLQTKGSAIEGTVNRVVFMLRAGEDEECREVRIRLKCNSSISVVANESSVDPASGGDLQGVESNRNPLFVQKSSVPTKKMVLENGMVLPQGWEPRPDVSTDELHDVSTLVSPHLEAGKPMILSLDLFRPANQQPITAETDVDSGICKTDYEIIIAYKQRRNQSDNEDINEYDGEHVMILQSGSVTWISPFKAEFSLSNGQPKSFPCGMIHPSNMVVKSALKSASSEQNEIVATDGEKLQMRCLVEANGFDDKFAGEFIQVMNECGNDQTVLFSSDKNNFVNDMKPGAKLSLSYSVVARLGSSGMDGRNTMPIGTISIHWKPRSLSLPDDVLPSDTEVLMDTFGLSHGPLVVPDVTPVKFFGPRCLVMNAPFLAKLAECPSAPKVGTPFRITYRVLNNTAKSQILLLSLSDPRQQDAESSHPSDGQLLITGALKGELRMAPFEEKLFSYKCMCMVAGRVLRPPLSISSGRHQSWVVNESVASGRYLYIMP